MCGSALSKKAKKNPSGCVTHAECAKIVTKFNGELQTIKNALIGEDMRGGIVKDVAEIKNGLNRGWKPRDYVAIIVSFVALVGTIVSAYLLSL